MAGAHLAIFYPKHQSVVPSREAKGQVKASEEWHSQVIDMQWIHAWHMKVTTLDACIIQK